MPRIDGIQPAGSDRFEADVRRTGLYLMICLVLPASAGAQDASSRAYWKPVTRGWHTVVIPAPQVAERPSLPHTTVAPALRPVAIPTKPLTGYAHELGGLASYYWQEQLTSSGERFDKRAMTAAHRTLPLGTRVRVTNLSNGRSTIVRINDRGPFKPGRVIDLSEAAAEQISMTGAGLARVSIDVVH